MIDNIRFSSAFEAPRRPPGEDRVEAHETRQGGFDRF
jgi:hypothetical protein